MRNKLHLIALLIAQGVTLVAAAEPLPPILKKSAVMQCEGRKIELQGDCFSYVDEDLACTRKTLMFSDAATGKRLNVRQFKAAPKVDGDDYPIVVETFGTLSCVETSSQEKYIVAAMDNGGNCARCEWHDVYTLDGELLGNDRDRKKKIKAVGDAVSALYDKKTRRVLNKNELVDFYIQRMK